MGIVFMRLGIAKVDQDAIAEVLRNVPIQALDHCGACGRKERYSRTYTVRSMMERILSRVLSFCEKAVMMPSEAPHGPFPGVSRSDVRGVGHPVLTRDEPEPEQRQRSRYDL